MHAVDEEVLNQVTEWLLADQPCWLATVVGTWGSSPRPVGSLLACNAEGHIVGSLSGGCVEEDLLDKLTSGELAAESAQTFEYGVTAEESEKFGLPCGGSLLIVIEPLAATAAYKAHLSQIRDQLAQRRCVKRTVNLKERSFTTSEVSEHEPLRWDADSLVLEHTYGPRYQLFIIGAGMVSKYLAEMAQMLDYQVTVCDPREDLLGDFGIKGVNLVADMPDDAIKAHASDPASAIVALTHDPRIDDMGMMQALTTDAFYVGAMGSTRTSQSRRERLAALELSAEQIAKLHAPIGLPIGSKTPPEIAIAILAEITAVRKARSESASAHLAQLSAG